MVVPRLEALIHESVTPRRIRSPSRRGTPRGPRATDKTNRLLFLVLLIDLIDDVGGVLECFVEFVQLLAAVGVVIGLEFFDNGRSVVYVSGEFAESVGRHE